MSNDFINRRQVDDRRKRRTGTGGSGGGTNPTPGTFIRTAHILPEWNTYIRCVTPVVEPWSSPTNPPNERLDTYLDRGVTFTHWTSIGHVQTYQSGPLTGIGIPYTARELPVALLNPWCDHGDRPFATVPGITLIPRTPTRSLLAFNMSGVPTGANILSADLNLTVSGSSFWVTQQQIQTNRIQRDPNKNFVNEDIWISFQFDGSGTTFFGDEPLSRAHGWGGGRNTFTWLKFLDLSLFGVYNPAVSVEYDGTGTQPLNPWSLKKWYQWGARQFHLHMPFGRPAQNLGPESLAYQADAYLCARDGFTGPPIDSVSGDPIAGIPIQYNIAMPWLTTDFVSVWSSLIKGQKHTDLSTIDWNNILQWYDPADPIRVIAYNGAISFATKDRENQYARWNQQYSGNPQLGLQRLKDSVQPFIDCGMQIAIDALVSAPGPVPGAVVPSSSNSEFASANPGYYLSNNNQSVWWDFFVWLKDQVGITNIYCEAYPYRRTLTVSPSTVASPIKLTNPYLPYVQQGMGIMSNEEFSYISYASNPDKHTFAELGDKCRYIRNAYWAGANTKLKTKRNELFPGDPLRSLPRYPDFDRFGVTWNDSQNRPADPTELEYTRGDRRFDQNDPNSGYGSIFMYDIVGRNILDPIIDETEPVSGYNRTIPGVMIPNKMLQIYATLGLTYIQAGYSLNKNSFGITFATGASFNNALRSYKTLSYIETHPLELVLVKGNPPKTVGWKHPLFADDPGGTHEWNANIYHNNVLIDPYFTNNVNQSYYITMPSNFAFLLGNNAFAPNPLSILLSRLTNIDGLYHPNTASFIPIMSNTNQSPTIRHEIALGGGNNVAYVGGLATDRRIPKIRFAVSPFDGDRNIINATTLVQGFHSLPRQIGGNTLTVALVGAGSTLNWQNDANTLKLDPYLESRPIIPSGEATSINTVGNSSYYNNWFKTNSHIKFHSIFSGLTDEITSSKIAFFKDFYKRGFVFTLNDIQGICQGFVNSGFVGSTMEIHFNPSFNATQVFSGISFGANGLPITMNKNNLGTRAGRINGPAGTDTAITSVVLSSKFGRMMGLNGNIAVFKGADNTEFTYNQASVLGNPFFITNNNQIQYSVNPMRIRGTDNDFVPPGLSGFDMEILGNQTPNTNATTIYMSLKTGFTASAGVNNTLVGNRNLIALNKIDESNHLVSDPNNISQRNIGIVRGSYISIQGSSVTANNKIYRVIDVYPSNPTVDSSIVDPTFDPDNYQYIEVDSDIVASLEGPSVIVKKIDVYPILTVTYSETVQ